MYLVYSNDGFAAIHPLWYSDIEISVKLHIDFMILDSKKAELYVIIFFESKPFPRVCRSFIMLHFTVKFQGLFLTG
jgi:hypothetical protein